jgi:hypothetical protein
MFIGRKTWPLYATSSKNGSAIRTLVWVGDSRPIGSAIAFLALRRQFDAREGPGNRLNERRPMPEGHEAP